MRTLLAVLLAASPSLAAGLRITEIDYDQLGTDASEFVELRNDSGAPIDLANLALVFVNGADGLEYRRVALAGTLQPGQYFVAASPTVAVAPGALVARFSISANAIQNGAPDGVVLFDLATSSIVDALAYEGVMGAFTVKNVPGTFAFPASSVLPLALADTEMTTSIFWSV